METLLARTVRFSAEGLGRPGPNGFAGSPPVRGLGPWLEVTVEVRGRPDPESGYLLNIKTIDRAVHERVRPLLDASVGPEGLGGIGRVLGEAIGALGESLPVRVERVELRPSPYYAVAMSAADPDVLQIRLQFDFAAAHRLHVAAWSDEANREHFGKCNNPNGHGHNYRLEVTVNAARSTPGALSIQDLERTVTGVVIDRFDHKHLNLDTAEFADGTGLIPSVENIARVCYDLLEGPVGALGEGVSLDAVRVWETDRTSSRYPA